MAPKDSTQASTNRYSPNSGGSQDDVIDRLIAQGATDDEIMAVLAQMQGDTGAAAVDTMDAGALDDLFTRQFTAQQDQQETENLLALLDYFDSQDAAAPAARLELPQGSNVGIGSNFQSTGDGAADRYAAQQRRFEMLQALNADKIMRNRNREDALFALQNQPAAPTAAANPMREQVLQAILNKLMPGSATGGAAGVAGATAPMNVTAPPPQQGFTPDMGGFGTMGDDQIVTPGAEQFYRDTRMNTRERNPLRDQILGRLMGVAQ